MGVPGRRLAFTDDFYPVLHGHIKNFLVLSPHEDNIITCITIGMTEIGHDSHFNLFQGTVLRKNHAIHDRMLYSVHVGVYTHSKICKDSLLIILFLSHKNTAKGDGENTNT